MNSALTYTQFVDWFPEFEELPQNAVERQIDLSTTTLEPSVWGKWYEHAVCLFTAHYLAVRFNITNALFKHNIRSATNSIGTTNNRSATTSGITEGVALSGLVTSTNPIDADFARTSYGLEYLSLLNTVIPPGAVVYSPSAAAVLRSNNRLI